MQVVSRFSCLLLTGSAPASHLLRRDQLSPPKIAELQGQEDKGAGGPKEEVVSQVSLLEERVRVPLCSGSWESALWPLGSAVCAPPGSLATRGVLTSTGLLEAAQVQAPLGLSCHLCVCLLLVSRFAIAASPDKAASAAGRYQRAVQGEQGKGSGENRSPSKGNFRACSFLAETGAFSSCPAHITHRFFT